MKSLNEVQLQTCKELFIYDTPLSYADIIQLVNIISIIYICCEFLFKNFYIFSKDKFYKIII